jgi:hypothetical protein
MSGILAVALGTQPEFSLSWIAEHQPSPDPAAKRVREALRMVEVPEK